MESEVVEVARNKLTKEECAELFMKAFSTTGGDDDSDILICEIVSARELSPSFPTPEKQFKIAYSVFAEYAEGVGSGNYLDIIINKLRVRGVNVSNEEEFFKLAGSLESFFEVVEKDRFVTFRKFEVVNEQLDLSGSGDETVSPKRPWKVLMITGLAIAAMILAIFFLSKQIRSEPVEIKAKPEARLELRGKATTADSISFLISRGYFSRANEMLKRSKISLNDRFVADNKRLINKSVASKADSLKRAINYLAGDGKYYEAFFVEQKNDKDVFQLLGNNASKLLRQDLITGWVLSCENLGLSETQAVTNVTEQVNLMLGSSGYQVVASFENGATKFYLDYDPPKKEEQVASISN